MNIIKKIFSLIQNFFNKDKMLQLDSPKTIVSNKFDNNFLESLKVQSDFNKKKVIETLICPGTGLGMQGKISY